MADNALTHFRNPRLEAAKEDFAPFPVIKELEPRRVFERYHRPADPLMGTAELEDLAEKLGGAETLGDAAVTAAGIATGVFQGRNARRASKAADAPPKRIEPPEGGSHGRPLPGNEKIPRELREGVKAKPVKSEIMPELNDGFYLEGEKFLLNTPMKQGAERVWRKEMGRAGVKPVEMQALKMDEFFKANPEATKDQLLEHYKANKPRVRESTYGNVPYPAWGDKLQEFTENVSHRIPGISADTRFNLAGIGEELALRSQGRKAKKMGVAGESKYRNWSLDKPDYGDGPHPVKPKTNETYKEHVRSLAPSGRHAEINKRIEEIGNELNSSFERETPRLSSEAMNALHSERSRLQEERTRDFPAENYREAHFSEAPGYLYHHRGAVQKDEKGRKAYNMDELQATGAQKIRDAGPRDEAAIRALDERGNAAKEAQRAAWEEGRAFLEGPAGAPRRAILDPEDRYIPSSHQGMSSILSSMSHHSDLSREQKAQALALSKKIDDAQRAYNLVHAEARNAENQVPGHPITNSMDQVSLTGIRDVIKKAVDSGVEGITITPGDVQNKRYGLSAHVDSLEYDPGNQQLIGYKGDRGTLRKHISPDELPAYVGQDVAKKLLAQELDAHGRHHLAIAGTEIGGKGMREYYDERYPNTMEKELRRIHKQGGVRDEDYPAREQTRIRKHGTKDQYHELPFNRFALTPEVRERVKKGLPLFTAAGLITPQVFNSLTQPPDDEDRR